jgi:hypothetical protein
MPFQWLEMRITEESDRRQREAEIQQRLPVALEEVHGALKDCVDEYRAAFGDESAVLKLLPTRIMIDVRGQKDGRWEPAGRVEIVAKVGVPGFEVDRGEGIEPLTIEVGLLPGNKLYYRDRERDQYVTMDELTKRMLDRALFPNLKADI